MWKKIAIYAKSYRDYTLFLNDEEREAFELEEKIENRKGVKNHREFPRFSHPDESVREFIWHRRSLFPNNYLHLLEYKKLDFDDEADQYHDVIYKAKNEQEIQQYIKQNRKWFIPGSIFLDYNFGHHDAFLFPEQSRTFILWRNWIKIANTTIIVTALLTTVMLNSFHIMY